MAADGEQVVFGGQSRSGSSDSVDHVSDVPSSSPSLPLNWDLAAPTLACSPSYSPDMRAGSSPVVHAERNEDSSRAEPVEDPSPLPKPKKAKAKKAKPKPKKAKEEALPSPHYEEVPLTDPPPEVVPKAKALPTKLPKGSVAKVVPHAHSKSRPKLAWGPVKKFVPSQSSLRQHPPEVPKAKADFVPRADTLRPAVEKCRVSFVGVRSQVGRSHFGSSSTGSFRSHFGSSSRGSSDSSLAQAYHQYHQEPHATYQRWHVV